MALLATTDLAMISGCVLAAICIGAWAVITIYTAYRP